jgi:predicted nucleic acid-binding protein
LSVYLDASVLLPTLFEEANSSTVGNYLAAHPERLISDFAAAEVASAVSRLVRTRGLDAADADRRLSEFDAWRAGTASPAEFDASDIRRAYVFVRHFDLMLRAPDALHLAATQRLGGTLVTLDRRMARAAQNLGIDFDVPGDPP